MRNDEGCFERLGTIIVANREHHCVFHFDVEVTETEQLVFNSHSSSAIILCGNIPASALDSCFSRTICCI